LRFSPTLREQGALPMYRSMLRLGLLVAFAFATWAASSSMAATASTAPPTVSCAIVPDSNYCLTRISFISQGSRSFNFALAHPYKCRSGVTSRLPTAITFDLKAAGPCAQEPLFAQRLRLVATGKTTMRGDGLGDFFGEFRIGPPSPTGPGISRSYVSGCIELLERVGSHHAVRPAGTKTPCEVCDQNPHTEGWVMGAGVADTPFAGGFLRGILVASSVRPSVQTPTVPFVPTIDGVWVRRP